MNAVPTSLYRSQVSPIREGLNHDPPVTASMLYDLVFLPHRVTMDLFADPAQRDGANPFVKLLWERAPSTRERVIEGLEIPFTNLSMYVGDERNG